MKKRISIVLLIFLIPILFGCQKAEELPCEMTPEINEKEQTKQPEQYKHICVDISDDDGGFYALMADTKLEYYEDEIVNIFIENPTLLAFKVPDQYTNGVGIIDGNNILKVQKRIREHLASENVDAKTKVLLNDLLNETDRIYLLSGAST